MSNPISNPIPHSMPNSLSDQQQPEMSTDFATPAEATDLVKSEGGGAEGQMTELSDGDLDNVSGGFSGGFSFGDLGGFFQESSSFFSETNIFFEQTSFAGRNGAGGKTTFALQTIESGNSQRAGGFGASANGCG